MKKYILGSKIEGRGPTAIKCTETNKVMTDPEEIKSKTLDYCIELLKTKPAMKEYDYIIQLKK